MIPRGAEAIGALAQRIGLDLIPKAPDAFTAADLGFITALLGLIAQDFDRAAHVLTTEHEAMRTILLEVGERIADPALRARIAQALAIEIEGLRVQALNARADVMMGALIAVHAAVEDAEAAGQAWAGPLNLRIWAFLERFVANRAYEAAV